MIKLTCHRYGKPIETQHESFADAAKFALNEADSNGSYPVGISEGENVLWENKGLFSDSMLNLARSVNHNE